MKSIIILYLPGHAGNFLTRLFSLSPETIPQVPLAILENSIKYPSIEPTVPNRLELYSFSKVPEQYADWQKFHRDWPDFQNQEQFFYFNQLFYKPFPLIVYSIHPHEFNIARQKINSISDKILYYVHVDQKHYNWVKQSQAKLKFVYRPNFEIEFKEFEEIKSDYNISNCINLTTMLDSKQGFIDEYLKIATTMEITPNIESALTLYQDWFTVRV